MRVLVAEDEAISRARLNARLTAWGYDVVLARDGNEAWERLQAHDAPSLAVLDWMMPGLDGTEVCRRVRERGREPYVYVLLLTGKDTKEDVVAGLDAGADDYITKPFDAQELEVRLRVGRRIVELQSELVQAREALRFQANHDALTGALNRRAVLAALGTEATRASRTGTPGAMSVIMVDLDHFKHVNDTYGHPAGDAVIQQSALRLQAALRAGDVLGRYGGEELIVMLPGCDQSAAGVVAERLRASIADAPIVFGGESIPVTCSLGVATSNGVADVEELIARADEALYRAKRAGRNRVEQAARVTARLASRGPLRGEHASELPST